MGFNSLPEMWGSGGFVEALKAPNQMRNQEGIKEKPKQVVSKTPCTGNHKIDLVHLNTAPLNIVYTILLEGKLIHGNREEALNYLYRKYLEILDINEQHRIIETQQKPRE